MLPFLISGLCAVHAPLDYTVVAISLIIAALVMVAAALVMVTYRMVSKPPSPGWNQFQPPASNRGLIGNSPRRLRGVLGYWHTYLWQRGPTATELEEKSQAEARVADLMLDVPMHVQKKNRPSK